MKIGTPAQRLDRAKEYLQGGYVWHAFRCAPLRERYAEHLLRQAGFAAFVPVEFRWVRVSRRARRRYRRPFHMIPRYVLVGFRGTVPWYRIRELGVTQGVVGWASPFKRGDELVVPGPIHIPHSIVEQLINASVEDAEGGGDKAVPVGKYQTLEIGQEARVTAGPFADFPAIIMDLVGEDARVSVSMFGRQTPTWLPLDALDPVC